MAIVGFGSRGGGPGGVLPASLGDGDLLAGNADGSWRANQNVPTAAVVGQVPFWDGGVPGRYRYTAGPVNGDVLVFDSGTGLWVPRATPQSATYDWGNLSIGFVGVSFLSAGAVNASGSTTEEGAFPYVAPYAGTLRTLVVRHGTPAGASNVTYTVTVNGVASALSVVLNTGTGGPVTSTGAIAVVLGDRISLQANSPAVVANCRPRAFVTILESV